MGLVEQGQEQAVLGVVLDVGGAGSVPPGAKRPPLAGRLALAAGQVDDHLVVRLRGRHVQHVDQQPLGVAIDRLGARAAAWPGMGRTLPRPATRRSRGAGRSPGALAGLAGSRRRAPMARARALLGASRRGGRPSGRPGRRLAAHVHVDASASVPVGGSRPASGIGTADGQHAGRGRPARRLGDQADREVRRRLQEPPRVRQQQRRPEVLARLPLRAEVRARARGQQLGAAEPHADAVLGGPAHLGDDLVGLGRHHGDPALGEIRLAPRADRVAEIPGDFLGYPHYHFPLAWDGLLNPALEGHSY